MANMSTLLKKGYLFAGVIMATNMFVGNEMKAMNKDEEARLAQENQQPGKIENSDASGTQYVKSFFGFLSSYENPINFIGGPVFSVANNYFKWCDYNPGWYFKLGCLGWRFKRLLNGMLQFEVNLNAVRGILWLIPGAYIFTYQVIKKDRNDKDYDKNYINCLYFSSLVYKKVYNSSSNDTMGTAAFIVVFLLQGFVSMPLTLHFSKFSISISLDSIIWGVAGMILELKAKEEVSIKTVDNY